MEGEHKAYRAGSELFVCFTSRQSMRLGSKSALSPGRTEKFREGPSRRLRSNGSKGHSSPMFPLLPSNLTGRKKNGNFETQEPSSPKVTCIGQVRVKSKHNKSRHTRDMSLGGDRKLQQISKGELPRSPERQDSIPGRPHQKWGHLFGFRKEITFNICEALRSFGAEFNCFVPCGGTPSTTPSTKENKETTTCGAMFAKWFMVLQEGDDKKAEELDEPEGKMVEEVIAGICNEKVQSGHSVNEDEIKMTIAEEEIATPPRNALLLMRCRSVPLRVACRSEPLRRLSLDSEMRCGSEAFGISSLGIDEEVEEEFEEVEKEELRLLSLGIDNEQFEETEKEEEEVRISLDTNEEVKTEFEDDDAKEDFEEAEDENEEEGYRFQSESEEEKQSTSSSPSKYEEIPEMNRGGEEEEQTQTETNKELPNALLLMMCEPKLSLEVSKETWVSSKDFLRRPAMGTEDDKENDQSNEEDCLIRAAMSTSKVVEEKLTPREASFVLTRCKSEPLRASLKLAPEACFWKSRNLESPYLSIKRPFEVGAHMGS
eukprot:Gb_38221 [translate_table: standard]